MNKAEIYKQIVLGIVNRLLTAVAALLIAKGFITPDQSTFLVTEIAGIVFAGIVLAWLWIKKHAEARLANKQIEVALNASPSTPIEAVKTEASFIIANS